MLIRRRMRSSWIEKTWYYKRIEPKVEAELDRQMEKMGLNNIGLGKCHIYWDLKKKLLRRKYGIWFWRSPAELNPHVRFD